MLNDGALRFDGALGRVGVNLARLENGLQLVAVDVPSAHVGVERIHESVSLRIIADEHFGAVRHVQAMALVHARFEECR